MYALVGFGGINKAERFVVVCQIGAVRICAMGLQID